MLNNDSTGVDVGETLRIASVEQGSANGKVVTDGSRITYTPAAGFIGTETFAYTINDGTTGSNATAKVTIRVQSPASTSVDFRDYRIDSYGDKQDAFGAALVENSGQALRLLGNTWKKIDLPYTITPDTMLAFDFSSTSRGDIHGIGFDNNNTITSSRTIRLHGRQNWGIDDFANYSASSGTRHYVIPVGKYYTGRVAHLFFVNDHDVRSPSAESLFQNIRIYEAPNNTGLPANSASDPAVAGIAPQIPSSDTADSAKGDRRIGSETTAQTISKLLETTTFTGPSFHNSADTATRTVADAAGAAGPLSNLQDRFGFHSLDHDTLSALDQIFAALGDAA